MDSTSESEVGAPEAHEYPEAPKYPEDDEDMTDVQVKQPILVSFVVIVVSALGLNISSAGRIDRSNGKQKAQGVEEVCNSALECRCTDWVLIASQEEELDHCA